MRTFLLHKVTQEAQTYTLKSWLTEKEPAWLAIKAGETRGHWDLYQQLFSL